MIFSTGENADEVQENTKIAWNTLELLGMTGINFILDDLLYRRIIRHFFLVETVRLLVKPGLEPAGTPGTEKEANFFPIRHPLRQDLGLANGINSVVPDVTAAFDWYLMEPVRPPPNLGSQAMMHQRGASHLTFINVMVWPNC